MQELSKEFQKNGLGDYAKNDEDIFNNSIIELTHEERAYILSFFYLEDARTEVSSEIIMSFIKKISSDIEIEDTKEKLYKMPNRNINQNY